MSDKAQINLLTYLLEEMCDIVEKRNEENDDLKTAVEMEAAQIHGLHKQIEVYQAFLKDRLTYNEYASLWGKAQQARIKGKDKWSPDEHQRTD